MPPSPSTPRISKRPMVAGGFNMAWVRASVLASCGKRVRLRRFDRQEHGKSRALADLGGHLDAPAVLLHDLVGDGKPQPGALPHFLGGEKRVEDLGEDALRNAMPIVGNVH